MSLIKIGIAGYGNIARGVQKAIELTTDCSLEAVFTRRNPAELQKELGGVLVSSLDNMADFAKKIDVMVLCGGSKSDLPKQGPMIAKSFNTVDSFDTHADIPAYLESVNQAAKAGGHLSVISSGWDPGLFSMLRLISGAVLPQGKDYTFWGRGVSQGHSDAIRRIEGVENAIQYTVPVEKALELVRQGKSPELTAGEKHTRVCYVVAKPNADKNKIEQTIITMPNYFADYNTTVNFISAEELKLNHSAMPHAGTVLRTGTTSPKAGHVMEFSLRLESNPEFTGSVMLSFARAAAKLAQEGKTGALTPFDIPLSYLSPISREELIKKLL